jgi:hypothetical protein
MPASSLHPKQIGRFQNRQRTTERKPRDAEFWKEIPRGQADGVRPTHAGVEPDNEPDVERVSL